MQHVIGSPACRRAIVKIADVALKEGEIAPRVGADRVSHLIEVVLMTGGEVIQSMHLLIKPEQGFQQARPDKSSHPGYQPLVPSHCQIPLHFVKFCHFSMHVIVYVIVLVIVLFIVLVTVFARSQAPDIEAGFTQADMIKVRFDIDKTAFGIELRLDIGEWPGQQFLVRHGGHDGVRPWQIVP